MSTSSPDVIIKKSAENKNNRPFTNHGYGHVSKGMLQKTLRGRGNEASERENK
jgi:hypothetical protein